MEVAPKLRWEFILWIPAHFIEHLFLLLQMRQGCVALNHHVGSFCEGKTAISTRAIASIDGGL